MQDKQTLFTLMNHQIKVIWVSVKYFCGTFDRWLRLKCQTKQQGLVSEGLENAEKGARYVGAILKGESAESGKLSYDMQMIDLKKSYIGSSIKRKRSCREKRFEA